MAQWLNPQKDEVNGVGFFCTAYLRNESCDGQPFNTGVSLVANDLTESQAMMTVEHSLGRAVS